MEKPSKILITGVAGFIGFHLSQKLLGMGHEIIGLDVVNDYYDQKLKWDRLKQLGITQASQQSTSEIYPNFHFYRVDLANREAVNEVFKGHTIDAVCHLAAQAGVRYSIENPMAYIDANIVGFQHVLEAVREHGIKNFSYASSSSVYGGNLELPYKTSHSVDHPISLYAATKKSNELVAHTYAHLFGIATTGLRFFTVYGPWGRPDMALFLFTKALFEGKPIQVFNRGEMLRDFTYVDDIVDGVVSVIMNPAKAPVEKTAENPTAAPYKVYNIGNNNPVKLMDFIKTIEEVVGKSFEMELLPIQPGDVPQTYAHMDDFVAAFDYKPETTIRSGIERFLQWYVDYYTVDAHLNLKTS